MTYVLLGVGLCLGVGIGAWLLLQPRPRAQPRNLRELARLASGGVLDGERCRVRGVVRVDRAVTAPASGRECALYQLTISVRDHTGWRVVAEQDGRGDFSLVDGSTVARVQVDGATLRLQRSQRIDKPAGELLRAHRASLDGHDELRVCEAILADGDEAVLLGYVVSEAVDGQANADNRAPTKQVVIRSHGDLDLVIADDADGLRDV